ncbi:MAG: hypothetical protein K0Q95_2331 [Bacteroidota bacterium]|jgi:hypothetical protein|nr:hypothetical protein [Bacteroidota bacterium]
MSKAEELFHTIASELQGVTEGKMFDALCTKTPNGKASTMFWKEYMIFKLPQDDEKEAMKLAGAKLFDPSGMNRSMKGWVQLSDKHSSNGSHWL